MKTVKLLGRFIWALNLLLAAGIILWTFKFVLFRKPQPPIVQNSVLEDPGAPVQSAAAKRHDIASIVGPIRDVVGPAKLSGDGTGTSAASLAGLPDLAKLVKVVGHAISTDPAESMVFLDIVGKNRQKVLTTGESLVVSRSKQTVAEDASEVSGGDRALATVLEITDKAVTFDYAGGKVLINVDLVSDNETATAAAPREGVGAKNTATKPTANLAPAKLDNSALPSGEGKDFKSQIDPQNPNRWFIDPVEKQYALDNEEKLLGEVKLRPYQLADGKVGGIIVDDVQPGSIANKRGLMVGDVVKQVNGQPVDSMRTAQSFFRDPAIRASNRVVVVIDRAGREMTMEFVVR
jgi:hypothetical protein